MRGVLVLLLAGVASPALAQHASHAAPAASQAQPSCTPEHAAMGHCTMPDAAASESRSDAGGKEKADPHAGHEMPATPVDPHAGHSVSEQGEHSRHGGTAAAPPVAPPPPEALSGPAHAADLVFGQVEMLRARRVLVNEHGNMRFSKVLIDQLEARVGKGRDGYFLNAEAWHGGDINKVWLKSEIEGERGRAPEHAEVQALWSRALDPWFDLQAGVRFDANKGPNRTHVVLGVQGLAPYWWEVDGAVFLSNKGEITARAEAEYDLRITQKLILQPRLELDLSAQDIEELGIGSGLSTADAGLRLRYQISQQFSPYVGLSYERAFGDARRFKREDGDRTGGLSLLAGVRMWF